MEFQGLRHTKKEQIVHSFLFLLNETEKKLQVSSYYFCLWQLYIIHTWNHNLSVIYFFEFKDNNGCCKYLDQGCRTRLYTNVMIHQTCLLPFFHSYKIYWKFLIFSKGRPCFRILEFVFYYLTVSRSDINFYFSNNNSFF